MQGKKVLLVEDDEDIQRFVSRVMQFEGADLTVCGTGEDGESRLLADNYDVVLLDINLPGISGWEVLEEATAHRVASPIVVFTASVSPSNEHKAITMGARGFIMKPVGARELVERLRALIAT
jgi:two-component system response regulator CpxR